MDDMEARCVLYVKVGMFDQLEQSKICVFTITTFGLVMLTVQYELIVSLCVMSHPQDLLRKTSPDILSVEGLPVNI